MYIIPFIVITNKRMIVFLGQDCSFSFLFVKFTRQCRLIDIHVCTFCIILKSVQKYIDICKNIRVSIVHIVNYQCVVWNWDPVAMLFNGRHHCHLVVLRHHYYFPVTLTFRLQVDIQAGLFELQHSVIAWRPLPVNAIIIPYNNLCKEFGVKFPLNPTGEQAGYSKSLYPDQSCFYLYSYFIYRKHLLASCLIFLFIKKSKNSF